MTSTIALIIVAAGIGLYHDTNKPTQYELSMEDGTNIRVVLQNNGHYACPLYCDVDHIHHAVVFSDNTPANDNQFVYDLSESDENGISFFCSTRKILSMSRLATKKTRDELPDIINTSTEE